MNKKFSTLLMGGLMLAGAVNAQTGIVNLGTSSKAEAGNKYFLQAGSQVSAGVYPLIQYNAKDSLIANTGLGASLSAMTLDAIDGAMWTLSKGTSTSTAHGQENYYEFKDADGALFQVTLKRKDKADEVLSKWIIPSLNTDASGLLGLQLKAFAADGTAWYVAYDKTNKGFYPVSNAADAVTIYVKKGEAFALSTTQMPDIIQFNVVNKNGEDVAASGDIFDGKTLKASDNGDGTYALQDITEMSKYLGLAKTKGTNNVNMWTIPNVTYPDGAKLVSSALKDSKNNVIAYSQYTFMYNPMTGLISTSLKVDAKTVQLAFAKLESTIVLTTVETMTSAFEAAYLTFSKGTPAALADGDGVYFIEFLDKTIKEAGASVYNKYATENITGHATTNNAVKESDLSAIKLAGQWLVKADADGKYAIVSRKNNEALNGNATYTDADGKTRAVAVELYAVDAENGIYSVGGIQDTVRFVKATDVDLTNKYLGYKYISDEDLANKAFGLEIVNNVEGADNYAVYVKNDTLLSATATGEPFEFKLATSGKSETNGAKMLGDTLYRPSYSLSQQYTDAYVVAKDNQLRLLENYNWYDVCEFSFVQETADEFKLKAITLTPNPAGYYSVEERIVVFNIKDNTFSLEDENSEAKQGIDLFKFSDVRAPEYATLNAPGHLTVWSAEGDGKALSYNPTNGLAEVKLASQTPYNEDMFKLWVDTACTADAARPVYYISTTNSLDSAAIAAGQKMVLVNPIDSISLTLNTTNGTATVDADDKEQFLSAEGSAYTYNTFYNGVSAAYRYSVNNIKATFVPATICGLDSLAIGADTLTNMAVNPAAMAFRTTISGDEANELIVESVVNQFNGYKRGTNASTGVYEWTKDKNGKFIPDYAPATYFLRIVNNVLVWSTSAYESHLFNIEKVAAPTANEEIAAEGVTVIAGNGNITIAGAAGKKVVVANILGQIVANTIITSDNATIAAPAGVVVVKVEGEAAVKAIVK